VKVGETWKYNGPKEVGNGLKDIPDHYIVLIEHTGFNSKEKQDTWLCDIFDIENTYRYPALFGSKGILRDYIRMDE